MHKNDSLVDMARRATSAASAALALALVTTPAAADNGVGAWSTLAKWPLIPLHALLLPDGRVLSYGSNRDGSRPAVRLRYLEPQQGPAGERGGGALDAAQQDRNRPVLQRADRPAAERRRCPARRRHLERLGDHQYRQQQIQRVQPDHRRP